MNPIDWVLQKVRPAYHKLLTRIKNNPNVSNESWQKLKKLYNEIYPEHPFR